MQTDETTRRLSSILIQLAKRQDELAATEAAATRFWAPCPPTVLGHRTAATLLRAEASTRHCQPKELTMHTVLPQNEKYLRDVFGSELGDGACVVDADRQVGYVRLEFGSHRGPDSAYWDGWFSVTRTRDGHPLSGKVMNGRLVQVLGSRS